MKKTICLKLWLQLFENYATGQENQKRPGAHVFTYKHISVPMYMFMPLSTQHKDIEEEEEAAIRSIDLYAY